MPTRDPDEALDRDDLRREVAGAATGRSGSDGLGLEVELLPLARDATARLPLHGPRGLLARLSEAGSLRRLGVADDAATDETGWWCHDEGGRLSFEPGGQLEVSTAYRPSPAAALRTAQRTTSALAAVLDEQEVALGAVGLDVWQAGTVSQQRRDPRYAAMDAYLAARGPAGRVMMRDTCALQLNLDLGVGSEAVARWRVCNLLAPMATATFACSPARDGRVRSARGLTWQRLDPTRTGPHPAFVDGVDDPAAALERAALAADVMFVRDGERCSPVRPGWRFASWLDEGHPVHGRPTEEDLRLHLTTLFHEVRPRGHLELRSVDAVPARWRPVVVALYAGAVHDPTARERITEILEPYRSRLPQLLRSAATTGVASPAMCALAVEVWSFALAGARRLAPDRVEPEHLRLTERFLDRFTIRGRSPADELAARLRGTPSQAVAWAAEPTPSRQEVSS